jgi:RNA polymerase sigma-70 factor (ECF subfamily)
MKPEADLASCEALSGFGDLEGLRRLAARLVRSDTDADDVVQESLLLGLRRAAGRIADVGAWLRGIVRNKARESLRAAARRTARESQALPGNPAMDPIEVAARVEAHDELLSAVKRLDEPCRSAVWLHYVEGHQASKIALELATPVETVRTRIKRGIAKLREDLDRRHRGKRADWVPSLAAFAGVEPTLSLLATSAAGATVISKPMLLAASTLAILGLTWVGGRVWTDERDDGRPDVANRGRSEQAARGESGGEPAQAATGAGGAIAGDAQTRRTIRPQRFQEDPAKAPAIGSGRGEGYFSFHYEQGYSFESQAVSNELEAADLVFKSCAGGISSVTLEAPGGAIVNLERFRDRFPKLKHSQALARAVVRAAPEAAGLALTAMGDDRAPASDAFVMRTRTGRWVAFSIIDRDEKASGGWTKYLVKIRWAMNESEPLFGSGHGDVTLGGIEVDSQLLARLDQELDAEAERARDEAERARQARAEPILRRLAELDRKAAAMEPSVQAREGADVRVAAVLDRSYAAPMGFDQAYVAATYSFEKATRDDVKATRNDWDFEFAQSRLNTRMVVDDRSLLWELGDVSYRGPCSGNVPTSPGRATASAVQGRLYAVHTADSDSDLWTLMRVEELVAGESMIFSWLIVREPAALREALESKEDFMQSPEARLQIRGGAGGGNPHNVALDRSASRIGELSKTPLDVQKPLEINERHAGYVAGGRVPAGMVFLIERVEYAARVQGDSNGRGSFVLSIGSQTVAGIREGRDAGSGKQFVWSELDREEQVVAPDAMPVRGALSVSIPVRPGQESQVYAEITNSSWADVTLSGRFVKAGTEPSPR